MRPILSALIVLLAWPVLCPAQGVEGGAGPAPVPLPDGIYSQITTPAGVVVCELYFKKTPMTVASHVGLAEGTLGPRKGQPFYDGLLWHRVVANFVVQGGDGGRLGYSFPDEIVPGLRHDGMGTLQMANSGPDTNGSQYCLMLSDQTGLNYNHTVFGRVVRGLEVLPQIKQGDTMQVKVLRIGEEARAFRADQDAFDALVAKAKKFSGPRVAGPEAFLDDPDGLVGTAGRGSTFLNFKLANVERFTGVRIMARVYARTPAEAQGEQLDAYLAALAQRHNVADDGALVVYLQDQDRWIVAVGKDSQASFIAGPLKPDGTKDPVPAGWNMDQAMAQFMEKVAPEAGRAGRAAAPPPATAQSGTRGRGASMQGLANRLCVVLDNLIFRLEPATAL